MYSQMIFFDLFFCQYRKFPNAGFLTSADCPGDKSDSLSVCRRKGNLLFNGVVYDIGKFSGGNQLIFYIKFVMSNDSPAPSSLIGGIGKTVEPVFFAEVDMNFLFCLCGQIESGIGISIKHQFAAFCQFLEECFVVSCQLPAIEKVKMISWNVELATG